ncbi:hypothetical protein JOF56_007243 [Kibdelosporangium banguiense]|uniref:Lipoprotein n=1 Tax=Kibdelosporangium banguiense TaxID=1365924 RepID=A0ABS4TSG5_9PSEU|nr:hypothetical protein [Kibdelosporangium banguiense]MBP2326858.1 hypothetical protein [Kibdelosporangium banguiense]
MRTALLTAFLVLAGCTSTPPPLADHGAAAITQPITTMDELVRWMRSRTESCDDVRPASRQEFAQFVGPQLVDLYEPFMTEWTTCSLSSSYPKVGLVLIKDMRAFQQSWRDAMTAGRVSDGPAFSFGNGFAITSGYLGIAELDLYYLRCNYDDPQVHQIPADVAGCVFANPEHSHH